MNKFLLSTLGLAMISSPLSAQWYYRGTSNDWAAAQMRALGGDIYQICQVFNQGDATGGPRFKIDREGDWAESYPASDYIVSSNQVVSITFNASSKQVLAEPVDSCATQSEPVFSQLYFRGTANDWAVTPMQRVAENVWRVAVNFDGQPNQRFKFDVLGDWTQNYGDTNQDGVLEFSGDDIVTAVSGAYDVEVNEQTLAYTLVKTGEINQAPVAHITGFHRSND
ncbi:hypothetical protein [Vibrio sp. H11]|uniref:hypothetical protein n=1 Tax=Vibrio sp. H11 TaxID=2565928 RepID=UPI0010A652E7|nr:hypothetical protein [Vibrio sp. H11]